jgi:hypothetical protein
MDISSGTTHSFSQKKYLFHSWLHTSAKIESRNKGFSLKLYNSVLSATDSQLRSRTVVDARLTHLSTSQPLRKFLKMGGWTNCRLDELGVWTNRADKRRKQAITKAVSEISKQPIAAWGHFRSFGDKNWSLRCFYFPNAELGNKPPS